MHIYIHTYIHTYIQAHINTFTHSFHCRCKRIDKQTAADIYGKSYSGKCRNRDVCSRLLVSSIAGASCNKNSDMHTCIHTYIPTYIHTCTHTYIDSFFPLYAVLAFLIKINAYQRTAGRCKRIDKQTAADIYGKSYSGKCRNRDVCSRLLVSSIAAASCNKN